MERGRRQDWPGAARMEGHPFPHSELASWDKMPGQTPEGARSVRSPLIPTACRALRLGTRRCTRSPPEAQRSHPSPGKTDTRWAGPGNSWGGGLTEAPSGEPSRAWGWAPARPLHGGERRLLRRSENIIFMDPGVGGSHRVCACHRFKCLHVVTEAPS